MLSKRIIVVVIKENVMCETVNKVVLAKENECKIRNMYNFLLLIRKKIKITN